MQGQRSRSSKHKTNDSALAGTSLRLQINFGELRSFCLCVLQIFLRSCFSGGRLLVSRDEVWYFRSNLSAAFRSLIYFVMLIVGLFNFVLSVATPGTVLNTHSSLINDSKVGKDTFLQKSLPVRKCFDSQGCITPSIFIHWNRLNLSKPCG